VPEYVNIILLSLAIYGMYQGIVAFLTSVTEILAYFFVPAGKYIMAPIE
jgi:hypothetical protein